MAFPVEERYILDAERKLGIRLPLSYKGRVRRNNGGELKALDDEWRLFPIFDTSDRKRIIKAGNDIVRETNSARKWSAFPPDAVAFAANGTGDKCVFIPAQDDPTQLSESVYYWDHETGHIERIAEDLADLISGLSDDD